MEGVEFYLRRAADPSIGREMQNRMMQMALLAAAREIRDSLEDIRQILIGEDDR